MKGFLSRFRPFVYSRALAYMLQSTEYDPRAFFDWYKRTTDFGAVMHRRQLVLTKAARIFRLFVLCMTVVLYAAIAVIAVVSWPSPTGLGIAAALFLLAPFVKLIALMLLLLLARQFVSKPRERKALSEAKNILGDHKATIIAVAGSYGKTSMKELLKTVLGEGKKVAATPANMNVATSHALFARTLEGDEEIVVIEFGEGKPGDVERFSEMAGADIAVITGLAPAHLDQYKTYDAAAQDIMTAAAGKQPGNVYMNISSPKLHSLFRTGYHAYNEQGCGSVVISEVKVGLEGTDFMMKIGEEAPVAMHTGLLGIHNLGPLAAAAEIAHSLGLTTEQIKQGIAKTTPFEHRMQPRKLAGGAYVIDDTYNGNIEGLRAGLALLKVLPAERKWYVTPGLVDQGPETVAVHRELGTLIAAAAPQVVVLMKNSATNYIVDGLREAMYTGEVREETDPLKFYSNLDSFLASGDLALLQNDWTDNYA